jgi:hypothetical protein
VTESQAALPLFTLARRARQGDTDAKGEIIRRAIEQHDAAAWDAFIELHQNLVRRWAIRFLQTYNMRANNVAIEDACQTALLNFYERVSNDPRGFVLGSVAQTMEYLKATVWSTITAQRRVRVSLRALARLGAEDKEALWRFIEAPESQSRLNEEEKAALRAELEEQKPPADDPHYQSVRLSAQEALVGVLAYHSRSDPEAADLLARLTTSRRTVPSEELESMPSLQADPGEENRLEKLRARLWRRCLGTILGSERALPEKGLSAEELRPLSRDPHLTIMQREEVAMLYRHFLDGMGMQEIYERFLGEFQNIRQVYRIKERLLRRLARHLQDFSEFVGEF